MTPTAIGEVDAGWLAERLYACGVRGRLRSVSATPVPRQGMTSLAHVLSLEWDGEGPAQLLIKFSLDTPPIREAMAANRGFEREVAFYTRFADRAGIPVPHCYWANWDAASGRCAMLLEYVADARATDVFTGSVDEVEQVVALLGPFHARWWTHSTELAAMPPCRAPFMVDLIAAKLAPALDTIRDRYRAEVGDTLAALLELWLPNAQRLAERERARPQTLVHGDLHRGQVLFPPAGPPRIIDWQLAGSDNGAVDLAHIVVAGLRPEQRRDVEAALVERYHAALAAHGVDLAVAELRDAYREGIARLALFYMTAFAYGDVAPVLAWWEADESRKGHSFWDVTCGWMTQALEDNQVLDHLRRLV
jgi:aminoglycoside phosphotransferase (APT) family kinase protein